MWKKPTPEELVDKAIYILNSADFIVFLIGDELNSFTHLRYLDYGPVHFWRDYPEFKKNMVIPEDLFKEWILKQNPK